MIAYDFISIDLPPLLTAIFSAVACALLGNYLLLRRMSLMGDAISHSVLPGIVLVFIIWGTRSSFHVFLGAAFAGLLTAFLIEGVKKLGRIESGASMGVVFSILFALGVLLMEQAAARNVDLDADCLLYGQLESIFWYPPENLTLTSLIGMPIEVWTSMALALASILFVLVLYKELKISSFDAELSTSLGFNADLLNYLLMIFVAAAVVASFKAVGAIIVIAMIICPAASARMFTDSLAIQICLSVLFAVLSAAGGYALGVFVPPALGYASALSAAGSIAVFSGVVVFASVIASPRYGMIARRLRQKSLALQVGKEDLLGLIFRETEYSHGELVPVHKADLFFGGASKCSVVLDRAIRTGFVLREGDNIRLTEKGEQEARNLVRTHRLWETYLVGNVGLREDHVHDRAMELEHFTSNEQQERLDALQENPEQDPHGRPIPPEQKDS